MNERGRARAGQRRRATIARGLGDAPIAERHQRTESSTDCADADDLKRSRRRSRRGRGRWRLVALLSLRSLLSRGRRRRGDARRPFFEKPVKLPFLSIELPLVAFFFLAPILFLVVARLYARASRHADRKGEAAMIRRCANRRSGTRRVTATSYGGNCRATSSSSFSPGPSDLRKSAFGQRCGAIAWMTLVVAPILLCCMMQIQFLPYHSRFITWTQRLALAARSGLIWWLWGKILSGREIEAAACPGRALAALRPARTYHLRLFVLHGR